MKIKSEILIPHVYLFTFDSQYDLCMSFVRMQEFYESDSNKFRGKYFTLEKYMDYWSKKFGNGVFTYTKDWNGFNLPGKKLVEWLDVFERDQREREIILCDKIDKFVFVSHWQAEKFRQLFNIPGYKTHVFKNASLKINSNLPVYSLSPIDSRLKKLFEALS
jgi:hypothetical protein